MPQRELTFGEKMVGLTFNPSNDLQVQKVKAGFAAIIDDLNDQRKIASEAGNDIKARFFECAIESAVTAQMYAVKAITWQY